jgi:hypothetical protein
MKRIAVVVSVRALAHAPTAGAHFVIVDPPGNGGGTTMHVGQATAGGHNSCAGHVAAASHEQSEAVRFLGPPACPPR